MILQMDGDSVWSIQKGPWECSVPADLFVYDLEKSRSRPARFGIGAIFQTECLIQMRENGIIQLICLPEGDVNHISPGIGRGGADHSGMLPGTFQREGKHKTGGGRLLWLLKRQPEPAKSSLFPNFDLRFQNGYRRVPISAAKTADHIQDGSQNVWPFFKKRRKLIQVRHMIV